MAHHSSLWRDGRGAVLLAVLLARCDGRAAECKSECRALRRRLEPVKECSRAVRAARSRPGSSNACLAAFFVAFHDECETACAAALDDDAAGSAAFRPDAAADASCAGDAESDACRAGYLAGAKQTRAFFISDEAAPTQQRKAPGLRETELLEPPEPPEPVRPQPTQRLAVQYQGADYLLDVFEGKITDAAAAWCNDNAGGADAACFRRMLALASKAAKTQS